MKPRRSSIVSEDKNGSLPLVNAERKQFPSLYEAREPKQNSEKMAIEAKFSDGQQVNLAIPGGAYLDSDFNSEANK